MFFRDFAVFTLGASALGTAGVSSLFGALYFFPIKQRCLSYQPCRALFDSRLMSDNRFFPYPLFFAIAYTLYDWYKAEGIGFLAYPWGTLPCAASCFTSLIQISSLCGVWGLSFLFSLSSAIAGETLLCAGGICHASRALIAGGKAGETGERMQSLAITARLAFILFLSALIYGTIERGIVRNPLKTLTVIIVQQNSNPWVTDESANILLSCRLTKEAMDALEKEGRKADAVIWSEGILNHPFPNGEYRYLTFPKSMPLAAFIKEAGVPFIIGGCAQDKNMHHYNAAVLYDALGNYCGFYAKLHLVPFAEVVPGTEYEWVRRLMKRVVGFSSGWAAGTKYTYFDLPAHKLPSSIEIISALPQKRKTGGMAMPFNGDECTVRVAAPVCFDDAFASVCRPLFLNGSEAFFNITDDSWSLTESAERQHLALARYRAIEYRTTLLRATNSGVSVAVDAAGKVIDSLPLFKPVAKAVSLPIYERVLTPYSILGDWLPFFCALAAIFAVLPLKMSGQG